MSFLLFYILSIFVSIILFVLAGWLVVKYNDRLRSYDKSEITRLSILAAILISLIPLLNFIVAIVIIGDIIFDIYEIREWFNSSPFE